MSELNYKYNKKYANRELEILLEELDNLGIGMYKAWNHDQGDPLRELNYDLILSKCNFTAEPGKKVWIYWDNAIMFDISTSDTCKAFEVDEGFLIALPGYQHCYFEDEVVVWVPRPSWGFEKCDPEPQWISLDVLMQYETISFISDHPLCIPQEVFEEDRIHNEPARKYMLNLQKETFKKHKNYSK